MGRLPTPVSLETEPVEHFHRRQVRFVREELHEEFPEFLQWTGASYPSRATRNDGRVRDPRFLDDPPDRAFGHAGLPGDPGHGQPALREDLNFVTLHGSVHSPSFPSSGDPHGPRGGGKLAEPRPLPLPGGVSEFQQPTVDVPPVERYDGSV